MKYLFKECSRATLIGIFPLLISLQATAQERTEPPPALDYLSLEKAQNNANSKPGPRYVPARVIPVPTTVSPRLQQILSAPYSLPKWTGNHPQHPSDWKPVVDKLAADTTAKLVGIRERLGVTIEPATIGGVKAFVLTPRQPLPASNNKRVLLYIHGGGFVYNPGEAGTLEATLMAGLGRFKVVSVDYRLIPDFPFPAALDDVTAVYKALAAQYGAKHIGVFGTSAGGNLTLALMHKAKAEKLPLPAAIAPGAPWADLTEEGGGDTMKTLEWVDGSLVSYNGYIGHSAPAYANGHDLRDPYLSPLHGDFHGFPPTILTSGTRDLFLSQTALTHRKLRQAGVDAQLQVFEGMGHAQYIDEEAPEAREVYKELSSFFDRHLQR